jgi:hypothetical protein
MQNSPLEQLVKNYSLTIILTSLFLISWMGQAYFQWHEFVQDAQDHNTPPEVNDFLPEFFAATFENWQSEFLQLGSMVVLTAMFVHKGSPESKDSDEKVQKTLNRIEKKVSTKK